MEILLPIGAAAIALFSCVILAWLHVWKERRKGLFTPFTEDTYRLPGHTLRKQLEDQSSDLLGYILQIMIVIVCWAYFASKMTLPNALLLAVSLGLMLLYILKKTLSLLSKMQSTTKGLQGEEYTGQELNFLMRDKAYVFHDIPYKYGNIDHIVLAPACIYVVETKAFSKKQKEAGSESREAKVVYDGIKLSFTNFESTKPLEQAKTAAKYLHDRIKKDCGFEFPVVPVVSLPGWYVDNQARNPTVIVMNPKRGSYLRKCIQSDTQHPKFGLVAPYIDILARSVNLQNKITDATGGSHFNILGKRKDKAA